MRYFTFYSAHFDMKYKIVNYRHDGAPGHFLYNVVTFLCVALSLVFANQKLLLGFFDLPNYKRCHKVMTL